MTFGYAWFMIGLFTGTVVLVVAVRGIVHLIQWFGWEQSAQDHVLKVVILLFVVLSFMLSRRVVRSLYRQPPRTRRIALGALAIPALACAYAWSNPTRFLTRFAGSASTSYAMAGGPTFIFGSYPDARKLKELKEQGVTTVVSLQDPRVVIELEGIKEEKAATAQLGIEFVQAPMLPWVSDNEESLALIRKLAQSGKGTYYVHCGLGRDRTNIAKRVIESVGGESGVRVAAGQGLQSAVTFEKRRNQPFQRGRLFELAQGVWVIPMPNPQEFHGYIVQGQPGHVFLVLNPADTAQRSFIAKAEKEMQQYIVKYSTIPTSAGDRGRAVIAADTADGALDRLVQRLRAQKPPFTIVIPRTAFEERPKEPLLQALLKAYGRSPMGAPDPAPVTRTTAQATAR